MKDKTSKNQVLLKRQDFLKGMVAAPLVIAGLPNSAGAKPSASDAGNNVSYLFDSTKCIGCRSCTSACNQINDAELFSHDRPLDLSERSRTAIRVFLDDTKDKGTFIKRQCMHCLHPACVSACPVKAMRIDEKTGIVYNDPSVCIGCRYCMVACPFDIIQFEWDKKFPKIIKCTMCKETNLKTRGITACVDVCPSGALIFGTRKKLLAEAKKRIKKNPKKYVPKVYGEKDGGGTNILYIAGKDFDELGFPKNLGDESPAVITESIQAIYSWFIAPVVAFFLLFIPVSKNFKKVAGEENEG